MKIAINDTTLMHSMPVFPVGGGKFRIPTFFSCFFFNDPPTTEIYPLPLHDALPIWPSSCSTPHPAESAPRRRSPPPTVGPQWTPMPPPAASGTPRTPTPWRADWPCCAETWPRRSEEHTSELQSQSNLVCRLLLEKKK